MWPLAEFLLDLIGIALAVRSDARHDTPPEPPSRAPCPAPLPEARVVRGTAGRPRVAPLASEAPATHEPTRGDTPRRLR